jgi:hypothetical protein
MPTNNITENFNWNNLGNEDLKPMFSIFTYSVVKEESHAMHGIIRIHAKLNLLLCWMNIFDERSAYLYGICG